MGWIRIRKKKNCRNKRSLIDTMEIKISSGQQAVAQIPDASKEMRSERKAQRLAISEE